MTQKSVASLLAEAAGLCEQGWIQGTNEQDGCFCAVGAIDHIFYAIDRSERSWELLDAAKRFVECVIPHVEHCALVPIAAWNDLPSMTQAEVVAKLREAAAIAAKEGK